MPVPARPRARARFDGWWFCNRRRRRRAEVRRPERPDAPVTVAHGDAAAVRPYFYINKTYYRVHLAEPYINYCYMPLRMPPERTDIFTSDKFCALEQQISPELSRKFELQVIG